MALTDDQHAFVEAYARAMRARASAPEPAWIAAALEIEPAPVPTRIVALEVPEAYKTAPGASSGASSGLK